MLARLKTAIDRVNDYMEGSIERIEELEQDRLYFDGPERKHITVMTRVDRYSNIVSDVTVDNYSLGLNCRHNIETVRVYIICHCRW